MLHKSLYKQSSLLLTGIALLSFSAVKSEVVRSHYFDVRDRNIGFDMSPDPADDCLLIQAVTGQTTTIYRNSAIQPSIAVNPLNRKLVAATFEQDTISGTGGSLELGIAHSEDGGKHWSQTIIPFQDCNGGFSDRVADAWLSYGPDGKLYLVALPFNSTLNINTLNQSGVVAAVSTDNGATWSNPKYLIASEDYLNEETLLFPFNVKPSITADPTQPSIAYAVWSNFPVISQDHSNAVKSCTFDGGLTWCPHEIIYDPFNDAGLQAISNGIYNNMSVTNNMIVVLPSGELLNFMTRTYAKPGTTDLQYVNDVWPYQYRLFDIAFVRSADQGATWNTDATVVASFDGNKTFTGGYTYNIDNDITGGVGAQTRTEGSSQFFNVAVNPENGYLYIVWQSGEFAPNQLPQIALARSRDGGLTWSDPVRVSRTPLNAPNPQAFTPAIAVATNGHIGLLYHDFRKSHVAVPTTDPATKTNVWFAEYKETPSSTGGSTGVGLNYLHELRVSKESYIMQTGPEAVYGVITNGDYNRLVAQDDDFYAVYIKTNDCPLMPAQTLIDDVDTSTILLLDNNKRTSPFFSRIDAKK